MTNYIRKMQFGILICGLLFCSACSEMKENGTEGNTSGEAAMAPTEPIGSQDTNDQREISWSSHAFLLGGEDIFFILTDVGTFGRKYGKIKECY